MPDVLRQPVSRGRRSPPPARREAECAPGAIGRRGGLERPELHGKDRALRGWARIVARPAAAIDARARLQPEDMRQRHREQVMSPSWCSPRTDCPTIRRHVGRLRSARSPGQALEAGRSPPVHRHRDSIHGRDRSARSVRTQRGSARPSGVHAGVTLRPDGDVATTVAPRVSASTTKISDSPAQGTLDREMTTARTARGEYGRLGSTLKPRRRPRDLPRAPHDP